MHFLTIIRTAAFRDEALTRLEVLIRGKRFFQCGYLKVRRLLEVALI